ncbi:response regulator [Rossellomorea aquimaris]|uniref:CitB family two-component system response regulator MalR n=1 Tax=Rossellomorea aquimaris TaxID=189382 RepID=A0A366EMK8_9BACI|nr:response regulator [Rossellomorea aquimaris]RBP03591.1 CitB family two-component system response regulator MalR [Rossellomorea aquimaris]
MINVLIVEDDPMVARFNQKYLEEIKGFHLIGISNSIKDASAKVSEYKIDLVLLDVYMPGKQTGMDLLEQIRKEQRETDVILITAASEVDNIQSALRMGVVDYLIKPFEFERFKKALSTYRESNRMFQKQSTIDQSELDLLLLRDVQAAEKVPLPKGLTSSTLLSIYDKIVSFQGESFSTGDIADVTSISRVSIRKYLRFLKDIGVVDETLIYGVGRPVYQYTRNKLNSSRIQNYL